MAPPRTYCDSQGVQRWRPGAVCPAHQGDKTCGQLLQEGAKYQERVARHAARLAELPMLARSRQQPVRGPKGCAGYLYDDGPTCPVFECSVCHRRFPLACGNDDDMGEACSDCWAAKHGERP